MAPVPEVTLMRAGGPAPANVPPPPGPVALDPGAFHVPLWIAPPPPPPPAPAPRATSTAPEPPPPPLRLQIIAVARDGQGDKALLYDPDTDRPSWVRAGQVLGPGTRSVGTITARGVEIHEGATVRTLALRARPAADSPLERLLRKEEGGSR